MIFKNVGPTKIILTISLFFMDHPFAHSEIYKNPEYGVMADLPDDLPNCNGRFQEHDHGFIFFLDPHDRNACPDIINRTNYRTIGLFSSFNAIDETKTPKLYRRSTCAYAVKYEMGKCSSAPKGLRVGTAPMTTLEINHPDGWFDIIVMAQSGRNPGEAPNDPTPSVNHEIALHTDRAHLDEDLVRFRTTLQAVRFIPSDQ
jgi:hypothetical protein